MVASEKITLRMEMFQSSLVDKFKGLRVDDQFLDCTLVCGKARIKAHRLENYESIFNLCIFQNYLSIPTYPGW